MKLPLPFLPRFCALALLCATPWVGALAQDSGAVTRVVPANAATPAPAQPQYLPDPGLPPPIGSGPDASPSEPPEASTPAPTQPMQPEQSRPAPAREQTPELEEPEATPEPAPPPSPYSIEIDLNNQRAYLLEDGGIIAQSPISSGRPGHLTPTGNFSVIQKDLNHFSTLYGSFVDIHTGRVVMSGADAAMPTPKGCKFVPAPMKWFMRFDGASGMHAGILPGTAASGCPPPRQSYSIIQWTSGPPCTSSGSHHRRSSAKYASRSGSWPHPAPPQRHGNIGGSGSHQIRNPKSEIRN